MIILSLKVDVLMSFRDNIYQQRGLIARNEFDYDDYVIDVERIVENSPIIEVIEQEDESVFDSNYENNIVVNVIGGA